MIKEGIYTKLVIFSCITHWSWTKNNRLEQVHENLFFTILKCDNYEQLLVTFTQTYLFFLITYSVSHQSYDKICGRKVVLINFLKLNWSRPQIFSISKPECLSQDNSPNFFGSKSFCKVEFNQPSCQLYFVPNLLIFQQLETLYLGGNLVRVVCVRV